MLATVVRARRPTSVRPGDAAVVLADGTIEGFVGGVCAESSVRLYSLRAMETGEPLLLRLVPGDGDATASRTIDGAVVERNPCLSGGALEIFLEPHLPAARLVVVGGSPIAGALERRGRAVGLRHACARRPAPPRQDVELTGAAAVVVASHGSGEEAVLAAALRAGVPYVALVASPRRGAAVRAELEFPQSSPPSCTARPAWTSAPARRRRSRSRSSPSWSSCQHADPVPGRPAASALAPAAVAVADPVCGMQVAIAAPRPAAGAGRRARVLLRPGLPGRYAAEHAEDLAAHRS